MNRIVLIVATVLLLATHVLAASPAAQSTAFTYQGNLSASGHPASGNFDLTFKLFDAETGGTQVGGTISLPQYPVANGVFTADLDFPGAFTGTQLWLEVTVGTQTLSPRQPVNSVPVAAFALSGNVGPQGPPGLRGYTSLIGLTPELPGNNCTVGGTKITAGADVNGNGALDPGEVTATSYLCNITTPTLPPQCNAYPLSWGNPAIDYTFTDPSGGTYPTPSTGSFVTLAAHPVDTNTCGTLPVTPFSYAWSLFSAPAGSKAQLSSSTDANPAFIPDLPGTYVFQANVTDALGNRAPSRYLYLTTSTCGANPIGVFILQSGQDLLAQTTSDDADSTKCPSRFQPAFSYSWSVLSVSAPAQATWQFTAPTLLHTTFFPSIRGAYTVAVNVSGSGGQTGSGSIVLHLEAGGSTATSLTPSTQNPSTLGQIVTFTAQLMWNVQAPYYLLPPTGSVTFYDGASEMAGCVAVPLSTSNIQALCTTSALTSGTHSITAAYPGDFAYAMSTSGVLTQTVN